MIVQFQAMDLSRFEGQFNGHKIEIIKMVSGNWQSFVDSFPIGSPKDSPKSCMARVEEAAQKVIKNLIKKEN